MPYATKEAARAYAKAHYERNKHRYNLWRQRLREARDAAPDFARRVLDLSEERFIFPDELQVRFGRWFGESATTELERAVYGGRWLPEEAKTHGLFMRRAPFAFHPDPGVRERFAKQLALLPKSRRGVRAELLVLTFVLKDL